MEMRITQGGTIIGYGDIKFHFFYREGENEIEIHVYKIYNISYSSLRRKKLSSSKFSFYCFSQLCCRSKCLLRVYDLVLFLVK